MNVYLCREKSTRHIMFRIFKSFTILVLLGFLFSPAFAEDNHRATENPKEHYNIHLKEIVVSTPMRETIASSFKPVTVLHDEELRLKASSTIGETLKNELGVNSQSWGNGVGIPVIRGQHGPRVRVLSNGLGNNDASQMSPDHASTTSPVLAERIEIIRGPATLLYGSGAIGGVVNVIDNRIPDKIPEKVGAAFEQKYNSVSNDHSTALKFEGKIHPKLAFHFDGFSRENKNHMDISGDAIDAARAQVGQPDLVVTDNTNGFVKNTDSDEISATAGFSWVTDSGFFGFSYNVHDREYGSPPEGSADAEQARIEMEHKKLDLKSEWRFSEGFIEEIRSKLSFTDYQHNEGTEALFKKDTFEGRIEMPHRSIGNVDGVFGVQVVSSMFSAEKTEDNTYSVPVTKSRNFSAFVQEGFNIGVTDAEIGLRVENATVDSHNTKGSESTFTPISISASDMWKIDDQNTVNIGVTRSQRAPQVQELFFDGTHETTRTYERGNPNLAMETSYNADIGYKFNSSWVSAELNLFHNWVDDYISLQRTGATVGGSPETLYTQNRATFMGYEAQFIFHLMERQSNDIDLTLFSDYTRGRLHGITDSDVSQMPPLRWGFQLDHSQGEWNSNLRLTRAEKQNSGGPHESNTPAYLLLNMATHYHVDNFHNTDLLVYAKGNNLLNKNYRNSTSFLRNFSPEPGIGAEIGVRITY